ncbi:hypothetical protein PT285_00580 [Lactobacillus sp. ESL0791]|nr:hypothetical protein [Lactobacillus sp. ESL0791]MDF7637934.1 hypothetical protein [Lactobacillus sp. ESL0791]
MFIPKLIKYYQKGQFPFDKLVKFFDFNDINAAFVASKDGTVLN